MFSNMKLDQKIVFLLGVSESIAESMKQNKYYGEIKNTLELCWEWYETKFPTGDQIYSLLDDGSEFHGLFMYMQMDKDVENEPKWDCIVDAVSYVDREAFIYNDVKYLPAPIENVDEDLLDHFLEKYEIVNPDYQSVIDSYLEYIKKNNISRKEDALRFFSK